MVKERDEYTCQRCGAKGKGVKLIAHHIEPVEFNPILSADIENGITLCKICNQKAHSEKGCRPTDLKKDNLCKTEEKKC